MTPLLICAYRPRYLELVLNWLRTHEVEQKYRIFAWDNGGAADIFRKFGLEWHCVRDEATSEVTNLGKAFAMHHLVDIVNDTMPEADCYVCMDDDIVVDRDHLDALVAAALRPGFGMIAPRFHPFNSVVPGGGSVSSFPTEAGSLRLMTYPPEDRTVRNTGRVAGGLFAISRASTGKLPWAPYLYPILANDKEEPVVYWTEDATLDGALTAAGLTNGYLAADELSPVLHLPELNEAYRQWKLQAQRATPSSAFDGFDG
ncbi:MAG: hypothetical protein V4757_19780 [Pseudomonadota bacterium]